MWLFARDVVQRMWVKLVSRRTSPETSWMASLLGTSVSDWQIDIASIMQCWPDIMLHSRAYAR